MGKKGGIAALAIVYIIAGALVLADGPLPFGDFLAALFLYTVAVPDTAVYAVGSKTEDYLFKESNQHWVPILVHNEGVVYYV